jgi:G:T-mismatch repair DNA endonuclease (very short patch repair protein)
VIEVNGGVHDGGIFDPDGSRARAEAARLVRLRQAGFKVLVLTTRDLEEEASVKQRIRRLVS